MTAAERRARTVEADALCAHALRCALGTRDDNGVALVAVGGYGRAELAPHSDLDLVLVHADHVDVAPVATRVWYPLWDAGVRLDHSVRALSEVQADAARDVRVALGLLDARHVAGDTGLSLTLRSRVFADWRRGARGTLPRLRELVTARGERHGELAHAAVPDLKESLGGLRDATVLKALVATWLVDVPHADLERCRQALLEVRDALHQVAGRATDRVGPELWEDLAEALGHPDSDSMQRHVRRLGRRTTHLSRLTWRRVDAVLARPRVIRSRGPLLTPVAPGVAESGGEVVLDRRAEVGRDRLLLLRAATAAAENDWVLAPTTAARLARDGVMPTEPWDEHARNLLVRLLGAGPGLLPVWETLDETGALDRVLPEWTRVRLLPHASAVHRFTVDRHLVETCIQASRMLRRVARPDLLLVAAVLHDIGKGGVRDHPVEGEPVAAAVAARLGLRPEEQALVGRLVRRHLLLTQEATTRDVTDPLTVERVADQVRDVSTLDMLEVLTEADARATAPQAWTTWRARLVGELAAGVRARLLGAGPPADPEPVPEGGHDTVHGPEGVDVRLAETESGTTVTVAAPDRTDLMAALAGAFAAQRLTVRAARAWEPDPGRPAVSVWQLAETALDGRLLRERLALVLSGAVSPADRLPGPRPRVPEPVVQVRHDVSRTSTVLEVRVDDRPGLLYRVCRTLARLEVGIRSAHAATLGPQAVDVFYLREPGGGPLTEVRAAAVAHAVRQELACAATLDP